MRESAVTLFPLLHQYSNYKYFQITSSVFILNKNGVLLR